MKKAFSLALLFALTACGDPNDILNDIEDQGLTPPPPQETTDSQSDQEPPVPENKKCNFWEFGCDAPTPDITDTDREEQGFDGSSDGYTDENSEYVPTLQEMLVGTWSGEYQETVNNSSKRLYYFNFKADGTMDFVKNPYGPNRIDWTGYWEVNEDNDLLLYDYQHHLQYTWSDLYIVPNKYFTFTNGMQTNKITMKSGLEIPEQGLIAEVYVYSETQKEDLIVTYGGFLGWGDKLTFDSIMLMLHQKPTRPTPVCYDWAYGITQINMDGGPTFNIGQIPGFDRYGGSKCKNYSDRFIIDFYGSLKLPAGTSEIHFNTAGKEMDDAAILFIDDCDKSDLTTCKKRQSVRRDMSEAHAVICNADDYYIKCQNDVKSPESYKIYGGLSGGWFPIELVYVEIDKNVYLNLELSVGGNTNFSAINPSRLTYHIVR